MKGCTKGRHNPNKPEEPEKPKVDKSARDEVIVVEARKPEQFMTRPPLNSALVDLRITVTPSLKKALEAEKEKCKEEDGDAAVDELVDGIRVGTTCKNNSCKAEYEGPESNLEMCKHHPGFPVFHEGLKYWTCCNKRTSDFTEFLAQEGCSTGSHMWIKKETKAVKTACRFDWHQTPTHVFVTIYAKNADPECCRVQANPVRLLPSIVFGKKKFEMDLELMGVIDVNQSSVNMAASKVEVKLRKAEPMSWRKLNVPQNEEKKSETSLENDGTDEANSLPVDTIDLSDI
ncbi:cysteine and histidine rich domain containing protein isoform X2 [Oratosquilla oratoria]